MQDKTWYSILGLDAEPLFLPDHMLIKLRTQASPWKAKNTARLIEFTEYGYVNRFRISDTNLIKLRTRASVLPKLEIRFGIRNLRPIHDKIHQNLTLR